MERSGVSEYFEMLPIPLIKKITLKAFNFFQDRRLSFRHFHAQQLTFLDVSRLTVNPFETLSKGGVAFRAKKSIYDT